MIEGTVITILLPSVLSRLADGARRLDVDGETVGEALAEAGKRYPRLAPRLLDAGGNAFPFVLLCVNDQDIRTKGGLQAVVRDGDVITVLPAIAGG